MQPSTREMDRRVRLQKFLAEAGVASRRASEQMILDGRVAVNGETAQQLGTRVDPRHDRVTLDSKQVRPRRKVYIALNKPRGVVCSRRDDLDRPLIYQLLPKEWAHLNTVGRLDYASEGLIFLTNDGELSFHLTHPRYGVCKKYVVSVDGRLDPAIPARFTAGVWHEGERLKTQRARILSASRSQSVVELELAEGKNREVRRLFESQGITVRRLLRTQVGQIRLGELRPGRWRTLTPAEIKSLLS